MKENRLKIIITLMSLAVTGLIAIQVYWIKHMLAIEEKQFDANVTEALSGVVKKIDKEETASVLIQRVLPKAERVFISDSLGDATKRPLILWNEDHEDMFVEAYPGTGIMNIEYEERVINGTGEVWVKVMKNGRLDTLRAIGDSEITRTKLDSFFVSKSALVTSVVDELIEIRNSPGHISQFNRTHFDSLITQQLFNRGIETEFRYAVTDKNQNVFLINDEKDTAGVLSSKHKIRINQGDVFREANYLSLYFPDKDQYIISSVTSVLGLSLFLILIIIGVFYKTIQMLIRQKKLTEIKNDLINNITHEFKTPISTISLACEALNEPILLGNPQSVPKYSGMIKDENRRLSNLVENLLNTAAIEKGEYKLKKEKNDIHEIINDVIKNYRMHIDPRGGDITLELNADRSELNIDEFHITNSINNLIDNAVKYSGDKPNIHVSTCANDGELVIKIKDNGIGISKTDQKKIFDTFYRVPTGNLHDVKGNGIGLSYTRKMIEAHGGSIAVKSELNNGSIFTIELPYE